MLENWVSNFTDFLVLNLRVKNGVKPTIGSVVWTRW